VKVEIATRTLRHNGGTSCGFPLRRPRAEAKCKSAAGQNLRPVPFVGMGTSSKALGGHIGEM
jgi:hypothetical protein